MAACIELIDIGTSVFVLEGFHKSGTIIDREDDFETGWSFYTVRLRTGEVINELTYPEMFRLEGETHDTR